MSKTPSSKYIVEFDNVQIHIGEIMGADDSKMKLLDPAQSKSSHPRKAILKEEKTQTIEGPTSMPGLTGLRVWDHRLLARYSPVYTPTSDTCEYCTYGKCDLTGNKEGACGIDLATQQSREALKTAVMGAACHSAHGRHLLDYFIKKYGREHPIDVGQSNLKAPLTSTITGIEPKTIGDFLRPIEYVEEQLVQLMAVLNTGQEGSNIDFESKSLHAGMLDHLGMEICDIVQMSCMNYPKSEMNTPIVEIGMGILDEKKPVVICIGHNAAAPAYILDYMEKKDLFDKIEIAENKNVLMPAMVCMDGFILSHVFEPVVLLEQDITDDFLPPYDPEYVLDPKNPMTFGALGDPSVYTEYRYLQDKAMENALPVIEKTSMEFKDMYGRYYGGLIDGYRLDDAEIVIAAMGSIIGTLKDTVDELRSKGINAGILKIRSFRPFPKKEVRRIAKSASIIVAIDKNISLGTGEGALCTEIKACLHSAGIDTPVFGSMLGHGGRDVSKEVIEKLVYRAGDMMKHGLKEENEFTDLRRELL